MTLLLADGIRKTYPTRNGELVVLRSVSISLEAGGSAVLMGPSGSGKSTLLNILGTLETPTAGSVTIDGCDPFSLKEADLARFRNRRIGFIFQDHHLLPQCSLLENVLLPTLAERNGGGTEQRARMLLDRVGLSDRLEHRPAELSGGERQRTAIARALINKPAVVLADEPTGNLDRASADTVATLLSELPAADGAVLLIVTHSERLAERFAMRYEISDGMLVE